MPRDMTACGRYPPQPWYKPIAFYSAVRLGEPEQLAKIMARDPYFITQDNGAGAPVHFATTYRQLDMLHHLLNCGAEINQRDDRGFTPLHRAAYLAHYDGYMEIFEYLLSRGADPTVKTEDYDPYLDPGRKLAIEIAIEDEGIRGQLASLQAKYAKVPKVRVPHKDMGCWWTLYDFGYATVRKWPANYTHPYPEEAMRALDSAERRLARAAKAARRAQLEAEARAGPAAKQGSGFTPAKAAAPAGATPVCLEGPQARLDDTEVAQPALFVAGLAAAARLAADDPVVKVRGAAMAAASATGRAHGMLTVIGLGDDVLEPLCVAALARTPQGTVCQVANLLFPTGRVVSGHKDALAEVQAAAIKAGAIKAALLPAMAGVTFHEPRIPVYSNVTAAPFPSAAAIPELLARQLVEPLVEPVQWEATLMALARGPGNGPAAQLWELGPGAQIKAMVKRIDTAAWRGMKNVAA
ncbi:hypothetical protein WJX81_000807 [Elliptochloris bilobata]|uniref:Malonyl-CoA:ACP transacylase (MAT) domain-containing protein n=1 Tax=Elliptochloris bilobata TaxID=381761 RepID=A0AAW1SEF3_9CHLO